MKKKPYNYVYTIKIYKEDLAMARKLKIPVAVIMRAALDKYIKLGLK